MESSAKLPYDNNNTAAGSQCAGIIIDTCDNNNKSCGGEKSDPVLSSRISSSKYLFPSAYLMASLRTRIIRQFIPQRRRSRKSWKTFLLCMALTTVVIFVQLNCGWFEKHFLQSEFSLGFSYPANLDNFSNVVRRFRDSEGNTLDFKPEPINVAYSQISFLQKALDYVGKGPVGLLIVVKSATRNYKKRRAIRKTWGDEDYLKQNVMKQDLPTKVVFICGVPDGDDTHTLNELFKEEDHYGDVILAKFQDTYGNNTFKTMLAMRWATEIVKHYKYLMIVDDDMYVNPSNTISFIQEEIPSLKVQTLESNWSGAPAFFPIDETSSTGGSANIISLKGKPLIMGELWQDSRPFRNMIGPGSKWSISIEEYPFSYFPPYIAGGATLFDSDTVANLYYASFFTKHFWIDDVYIGIIAYKLGIPLTHSNYIDSSYRRRPSLGRMRDNFDKMLALHGLQCPEQLIELWSTLDIESLTDCYYLLS
ncbi:unnamed protein product [Orchesella dallaii]|uniref:Hexosyltransferase n=1 Tax=Orchesella dallaii TaxID=48710 RepID=A0ABP1QVD8_9HEXA